MGDREAKYRRLEGLRRAVPHVSAKALADIMQNICEDPVLATRADFLAARRMVTEQETPHGPLFRNIQLPAAGSATTMAFRVLHLAAMLYVCFQQCDAYRNLMLQTLRSKPMGYEDPWTLILYSDEVTPGNQLSPDNTRKMWCFYVSFLEYGPEVLSQEDAWFCLGSMRTKRTNLLQAGVATVFLGLIRLLFKDRDVNFATTGASLGNGVRLYAKLGMIIQDGGAQKQVWLVKGDAGTKCCLLCRNLFAMKSPVEDLADDDGADLLITRVLREADLDFATSEDIIGSVRRLADWHGRESAAEFRLHGFETPYLRTTTQNDGERSWAEE